MQAQNLKAFKFTIYPNPINKKKLEHRDLKMVRSFVGKIQKGLSLFVHRKHVLSYFDEEVVEVTSTVVPDDVREGYFAVVAIKDGETKRFIVGLNYLIHPGFLELLEEAQEEYGFTQKGAIAVPCRPQELQKILDGSRA